MTSITKGFRTLVDEADAAVRRYTVAEALAKHDDPSVQFVDVRDAREIERDGTIPGAYPAPRGMIEFWIDPQSPYFKPVFGEDREFVFFCSLGWRSALTTKTVQDMGLTRVAHVEGGFTAWKAAGGPVGARERKG